VSRFRHSSGLLRFDSNNFSLWDVLVQMAQQTLKAALDGW
jgi:hypothetical protein